jgi:hypothetical protein
MPPQLFDLLGFVAQLKTIDRDLNDVGPAIVARACELVAKAARDAIGKDHEMWAALAPSTIADKVRQGYAAPAPLLRTGQLRNSIEWTVDAAKLEGCVGSDDPVAVYQELGTSRIPPRSFLVSSAISMEERIHKMAARAVAAMLAGHGLHSSELGELLHLLKHTFHKVKEDVEEMLVPEDEQNNNTKRNHGR